MLNIKGMDQDSYMYEKLQSCWAYANNLTPRISTNIILVRSKNLLSEAQGIRSRYESTESIHRQLNYAIYYINYLIKANQKNNVANALQGYQSALKNKKSNLLNATTHASAVFNGSKHPRVNHYTMEILKQLRFKPKNKILEKYLNEASCFAEDKAEQ